MTTSKDNRPGKVGQHPDTPLLGSIGSRWYEQSRAGPKSQGMEAGADRLSVECNAGADDRVW